MGKQVRGSRVKKPVEPGAELLDQISRDVAIKNFERQHGSITLLKTCVLALSRILVDKGVCTEEELVEAMAAEVKGWSG
jgi:hypothetical protein